MRQSEQRATTRSRRAKTTLVGIVSAIVALAGLPGAPPVAEAAPGDVTVFDAAVPSVDSDTDTSAVELGVAVVPRVNGTVSGIRFYKATGDANTHIVRLWAPDGTELASATSIGGQSPAGGSWSFTTRTQPTSVSIFPDSSVPTRTDFDDATLVQLGVRFTSTQAGTVSGIRFYKASGDANTHIVRLWATDGTELASATSLGETVSGWQTVYFAAPVPIAPAVEYRATYSTPRGRYAADLGALAGAVVAAPLSTVSVGGVYVYGAGYPGAVSSHNYWADVLFTPGG